MRVLIVDDLEKRHDFLSGLCLGHSCDSAWTAKEAINLLEATGYDLVLLDFDLEDGTTIPVAEHLAASKLQPVVILHTDNFTGAKWLQQHLPKAVVFPVTKMVRANQRLSRLKAALAAGDLVAIKGV